MQGIYAIVNTANGRRYVGSSTDVNRRWSQRVYSLKRAIHTNLLLQRAWTKHGPSRFRFVVVEEVFDCEQLVEREQYHIDASANNYNVADARCGMFGRKASESTRAKLRAAWTTRAPHSAETRAKMSASMKARGGHPVSPEVRARIAATLTGRKASAETKAKQSASLKGRPGIPPSLETRAKLSAANLGKRQTAGTIAKRMSHPSMIGKTMSVEAREKIRQFNLGRRRSESARLAMSVAAKRRYADGRSSHLKQFYQVVQPTGVM